MEMSDKVKVWLTCPESHAEKVRLAIGDAGLGQIGNYTHCSFVSKGTGYFKPTGEASPHIGQIGQLEAVPEVVIEFVCTQEQLPLLGAILKEHHPYEEVAVDVFPLLSF